MTNLNIDLSRYIDPLKEKLANGADILKEKLAPLIEKLEPLTERLEDLPYYPYSVIGIIAVILLLLIVMVVARKHSSSPKSPKKAKGKPNQPKRPRAYVTGTAVGLSSHEEYDHRHTSTTGYGGSPPVTVPTMTAPMASVSATPIYAAATPLITAPTLTAPVPATAAPIVTAAVTVTPAPAVTAQVAATPAPTVAIPTVTAPEPLGVIDPELKQAIKTCQEKFQATYMEMYIELGLTSSFDRFRTEVGTRLKDGKEAHHAISELKMTPEGVALVQMAVVAGNMLQSGECHTGKGQLDVHGRELLAVYRYALNTMQTKGLASLGDVKSKLDFMEKRIGELGG